LRGYYGNLEVTDFGDLSFMRLPMFRSAEQENFYSRLKAHPLADGGERLTALSDVAVLCANCHRLAHTTTPPVPIDSLKIMLTELPTNIAS
jgi:hypothetical protein